jgi:hypothetical protein
LRQSLRTHQQRARSAPKRANSAPSGGE